jgi:type II secretory pathway pseudopilin PulG
VILHSTRTQRGRLGFSLAEVVTVIGIMSLVVAGACSLLVHSSQTSDKTQTQDQVDSGVALAAEQVSQRLMEARTNAIDADGMGISYSYPALNTDGTYTSSSKATDSTSHRLYVSNGKLYCSDDTNKPVLTDIPANDPETGAALQVFSNGTSGKFIVVRLAASRTTSNNATVYSAITIRLHPRNRS